MIGNKSYEFDKEYLMLLQQCMEKGKYGGTITFFVDLRLAEYTNQSCINNEAVTGIIPNRYFEEFELPELIDVEPDLTDFYGFNDDNDEESDE